MAGRGARSGRARAPGAASPPSRRRCRNSRTRRSPGTRPSAIPARRHVARRRRSPSPSAKSVPGVDFQLRLVPMAQDRRDRHQFHRGTTAGHAGDAAGRGAGRPVARHQRTDARWMRKDGSRFPASRPGQYKLTARGRIGGPQRGGGPGSPSRWPRRPRQRARRPRDRNPITVWASADIVVDGRNLSNVMLSLQHWHDGLGSADVRRRRARPGGSHADARHGRSSAEPGAGFGNNAGRVDANGRFVVPSLSPGRYRLSAGGAPGWFVESANVGGVDALDFPFEVKPNQHVSGVADHADRPADRAHRRHRRQPKPAGRRLHAAHLPRRSEVLDRVVAPDPDGAARDRWPVHDPQSAARGLQDRDAPRHRAGRCTGRRVSSAGRFGDDAGLARCRVRRRRRTSDCRIGGG